MIRLLAAIVPAFLLFLFSFNTVFAQNSNGLFGQIKEEVVEGREKIEQRKERLELKREEVKQKLASRSSELREKRRGVVKEVFTKLLEHLSKSYDRLENVSEKIETRIEKIKSVGVDTSSVEAALADCAVHKGSGQAAISDAKTKVNLIEIETIENTLPVQEAKTAILAARKELNNYKSCLSGVVKQMAQSRNNREASGNAQ